MPKAVINEAKKVPKLGEKIGKGTAGEVYLAEYTENEESVKVAIKEIPLNS